MSTILPPAARHMTERSHVSPALMRLYQLSLWPQLKQQMWSCNGESVRTTKKAKNTFISSQSAQAPHTKKRFHTLEIMPTFPQTD